MQMERAAELESAWKACGNPPCEHPSFEDEYYRGSISGRVCTNCGTYLVPTLMEQHWYDNPLPQPGLCQNVPQLSGIGVALPFRVEIGRRSSFPDTF